MSSSFATSTNESGTAPTIMLSATGTCAETRAVYVPVGITICTVVSSLRKILCLV